MDYIEFLKGKIKLAEFGGFEVADSDINPILKPHQRAIQTGARDATQGPYLIISDPRGAAGIYETIEDARPHAEITARRSTFGRAAIVTIVAEVAMVPQWEGEA